MMMGAVQRLPGFYGHLWRTADPIVLALVAYLAIADQTRSETVLP